MTNRFDRTYKTYLYNKPQRQKEDALTITWFGTACELIADDETALLVDPFITRSTSVFNILTNCRVLLPDRKNYIHWIAPLKKRIKAMLVTQSHFDHILDAGVVGNETGAVLYGSQSTAVVGESLGLPKAQIQIIASKEKIQIGKFTITFLKSLHSSIGIPKGTIKKKFSLPARGLNFLEGETYVLFIQHPKGNIICINSANYVPDLLKGISADAVFLSITQMPSNKEKYFHESLDIVGATRVFPIHWDNFFKPLTISPQSLPLGIDLEKFIQSFRFLRPDITMYTLPVGTPQVLYS